jgi:hypothetical protein
MGSVEMNAFKSDSQLIFSSKTALILWNKIESLKLDAT